MKSSRTCHSKIGTLLLMLLGVLASGVPGQSLRTDRPLAPHVVVPQSRVFSLDREGGLRITAVDVEARIVEQRVA